MILRLGLALLISFSVGCEKDKRPAPPAKPEAARPKSPPPTPPNPGRVELVFSGAFERTVSASGASCNPDGKTFWVRSSDAEGPDSKPQWLFGLRQEAGATFQVGGFNDDAKSYSASPAPGIVRKGDSIKVEQQLVSDAGATVAVVGTIECPSMPDAPVPEDIVSIVKAVSGQTPRRYSTYDFGRSRYAGAVSVVEPEEQARTLVAKLRSKLPAGWVAYYGTTRWLGEEKHDGSAEVVVGPGASQLDILRIARSDAVNYGWETEALVQKLRKWDTAHGIDIFHAETDTIELELKRMPKDLDAFAEEVHEFCPDVVDQGVGSVEKLAEAIDVTGEVYLWWD